MKCTSKQIAALIERIRAGNPPKLPVGKFEEFYLDPTLRSFGIRLLYTGNASWAGYYKLHGKQKREVFGDVRELDRDVAREKCKVVRARVLLDRYDPVTARAERRQAAKATLATLAESFLAAAATGYNSRPPIASTTVTQYRLYLTGHYFLPLHGTAIDEITSQQVSERLDYIRTATAGRVRPVGMSKTAMRRRLTGKTRAAGSRSKDGSITAQHAWTALAAFYRWAQLTGKLPPGHASPTTKLQIPKGKDRERILSNEEIVQIWRHCEAWEAGIAARHRRGARHYGTMIQILFCTGMRLGELGNLRWGDVNLDAGESFIPGERTKNRQELWNPLSDTAIALFRRMLPADGKPNPDAPVFPQAWNPMKCIGSSTTTMAAGELDARIRRAGEEAPPDWSLHDVRRTFRTRLSACGVNENIAEQLIGHARKKLIKNYDRHEYFVEKRAALAKYDDHLHAVIDGTAPKIHVPQFGRRAS